MCTHAHGNPHAKPADVWHRLTHFIDIASNAAVTIFFDTENRETGTKTAEFG
jgi:hypothetical protein